MKQKIIYGLIDPITNELRYIGQTSNLKVRYTRHLKNAIFHNKQTYVYCWIRKLIDVYKVNPEVIIIDIVENYDYWEEFYISYYKSIGCKLTNLAIGGKSRGNFKHSKEHKQKMSNLFKGRKPWNTGLKLSDGHKEKIKLNSRHTHTEEAKIQIGKKHQSKTKVKQLDKDYNFIKLWDNAYQASKVLNINRESIGNVISKRAKTAGGYIWENVL